MEAVTQPGGAPRSRQQRRRERTRAALVRADQALLAAGKTDVPTAEITQAADVGTGSFESKDPWPGRTGASLPGLGATWTPPRRQAGSPSPTRSSR